MNLVIANFICTILFLFLITLVYRMLLLTDFQSDLPINYFRKHRMVFENFKLSSIHNFSKITRCYNLSNTSTV